MKKITLILSVMFIWGCSQAQDQEVVEKAKVMAKDVVSEQVETAKGEMMEKATDKATSMAKDVVSENVDVIKAGAMDKMTGKTASSAAYQAGIHYKVLNPAYNTNTDDEVIVYEFFSYMCGHCATFEPYMKKLENELPEKTKLVRIPAVFHPQWKPAAQAYYTFEAMGILDKVHGPMFEAIHQHKKQLFSYC